MSKGQKGYNDQSTVIKENGKMTLKMQAEAKTQNRILRVHNKVQIFFYMQLEVIEKVLGYMLCYNDLFLKDLDSRCVGNGQVGYKWE